MKNLFPLISVCLDEKSWRVNYAILENFENLILSVQSQSKKPLLDFYVNCMESKEEEVVIISFKILKSLSQHLEPEFILSRVLPIVEKTLKSENEQIKIHVASALPYLAPSIGKNSANKSLKDYVMELFKDKSNAVKIELLNNLEPIDSVIPIQQILTQIQDVLNELLNDNNWLVRNQSVLNLKLIFEKIDDEGRNSPFFSTILKNKLQDRVYKVRYTTLEVIKSLCAFLGTKWTETYCMNILSSFQTNPNYLYRLNYLFGMGMIHSFLSHESFE